MGTLLSIHKDVKKLLLKEYIDENDVLILWRAVGVKKKLTSNFLHNTLTNGYLNLIKWGVEENGPILSWEKSCLTYKIEKMVTHAAIDGGHIEILNYITHTLNCDLFNTDSYIVAIVEGHIHVLEWLKKENIVPAIYECCYTAIKTSRLDILKWLKNEFSDKWDLILVKGLEIWYPNCPLIYLMNNAIDMCNLKIFKWLEGLYEFGNIATRYTVYDNIINTANMKVYHGVHDNIPGLLICLEYLRTRVHDV